MTSEELDFLASEVGEVYFIEKDAKEELADLRLKFFDAVTASVKSLAQKTVEAPDGITPTEYATKYNPGWRVVSVDGHKVLIEEDPAFKGGSVVVLIEGGVTDSKGKTHPGYVVTKTIRSGSTLIDDERLKEVDLGLYYEVTTFPQLDLYVMFAAQFSEATENMLLSWLEANGVKRVMRSSKDLTPEQIEALKPFVYEGPKSAVLNVRYAKDDEQGSG